MMYTYHMYIRYNNNEHHTDYYVLILILKKVSHIRSLSSIVRSRTKATEFWFFRGDNFTFHYAYDEIATWKKCRTA
jgi:hypothetical protein